MKSLSNSPLESSSQKKQFTNDTKYAMFDNIEFFYYAQKFGSEIFVLSSENFENIDCLIYDFYLLKQTKINFVLIGSEKDLPYIKSLELFNYLNVSFEIIDTPADLKQRKNFAKKIPVYLTQSDSGPDFKEATYQAAKVLNSKKIFFLRDFPDKLLHFKNRPVFEMNLDELQKIEKKDEFFNVDTELICFFQKILEEGEIECVLLNQEQGGLYQEIFTHLGYGTIFSKNYRKIIRKGNAGDILPILLMTKIYEQEGFLLSLNKDYLIKNMKNSFVYLVENTIVAFAMLIDYGNMAELSKFCTQPRYQAKGKAKDLALKLIETAQERNYEAVFALSIVKNMWEFFKKLGFEEVPRNRLPENWKKDYDMSRPSKAFLLKF